MRPGIGIAARAKYATQARKDGNLRARPVHRSIVTSTAEAKPQNFAIQVRNSDTPGNNPVLGSY
jgi:hypothetical protein